MDLGNRTLTVNIDWEPAPGLLGRFTNLHVFTQNIGNTEPHSHVFTEISSVMELEDGCVFKFAEKKTREYFEPIEI